MNHSTSKIPAAPATKEEATKPKTVSCSACNVEKDYAEFSKSQLERRLKKKTNPEGGVGKCTECVRDYDRKRRYDITPAMIEQRLLEQGGKCALKFCEERINIETAHVDHDHHTKKVRGLLCINCNTGIGKLGDKIDKLLMAACYLAKDEKNLSPEMLLDTNRSMEILNIWHKKILKDEAEKSKSASSSTSTSESTEIK